MKRWQMEAHHHCHSTHPFSIFLGHPPQPQPQPQPSPWRTLHPKPFSNSRISCSSNNFPRWDSNAETFRPRKFNSSKPKPDEPQQEEQQYGSKRRWWSDDEPPEIDEEGSSGGVWEEVISSIWIFEVIQFLLFSCSFCLFG